MDRRTRSLHSLKHTYPEIVYFTFTPRLWFSYAQTQKPANRLLHRAVAFEGERELCTALLVQSNRLEK